MTVRRSNQRAKKNLPVFRVLPDEGTHPSVVMDRPVCLVGRQGGVNLPLDGPGVSKFHALIVHDGSQVYLRDLASTNGVQRNGSPTCEARLADDDIIRIGSYTLRCEFNGNGDAYDADDDTAGSSDSGAGVSGSVPPAELHVSDSVIPIPPGQHTFLIGRRDQCDLRLEGDEVASVHAVLFELEGKRYLRDLNTAAGTLVNGEPVHQVELQDSDVIGIGGTVIEFRYGEPVAGPESPAELYTDPLPLEPESPIDTTDSSDSNGDAWSEVDVVAAEIEPTGDVAIDQPENAAFASEEPSGDELDYDLEEPSDGTGSDAPEPVDEEQAWKIEFTANEPEVVLPLPSVEVKPDELCSFELPEPPEAASAALANAWLDGSDDDPVADLLSEPTGMDAENPPVNPDLRDRHTTQPGV